MSGDSSYICSCGCVRQAQHKVRELEGHLRQLFALFDEDGSGEIGVDELGHIIERLVVPHRVNTFSPYLSVLGSASTPRRRSSRKS